MAQNLAWGMNTGKPTARSVDGHDGSQPWKEEGQEFPADYKKDMETCDANLERSK